MYNESVKKFEFSFCPTGRAELEFEQIRNFGEKFARFLRA